MENETQIEQFLTESQAYHIHRLFSQLISILHSLEIDFWCVGGTLLGAVRCLGMVLYDDDIDIAINLKDKEFLHSAEFQKRLGWLKMKLVKPSHLYYKIKYIDCEEDVFIDICLIDENGYDLRKHKEKRRFLEGEIYPLREVKFSSIKWSVFIPNKAEEYLDRIFPDWRTTAVIYNHSDKKKNKQTIPLTDAINIPVKYYYK